MWHYRKRWILWLILILVFLGVLVFRGVVLKGVLSYYFNKYGIEGSIGRVHLLWGEVQLSHIRLSGRGLSVMVRDALVYFTFSYNSGFLMHKIVLTDGSISLDISEFGENLKKRRITSGLEGGGFRGEDSFLNIVFKDISFYLKGNGYYVKGNTSGNIYIKSGGGYSVKSFSLSNVVARYNEYLFEDISLVNKDYPFHELNIPSIRIKDKKFSGIRGKIILLPQGMFISSVKGNILVDDGVISGKLALSSEGEVCVDLRLKEISFERVIELLGKDRDLMLKGKFTGYFKGCLFKGEVSEIEGYLTSAEGGMIRMRRGTNFAFLRQRMDSISYNTLIDNLKNYAYNIGVMEIRGDDKIIHLKLHFSSQEAGERNIIVNFHRSGGGG